MNEKNAVLVVLTKSTPNVIWYIDHPVLPTRVFVGLAVTKSNYSDCIVDDSGEIYVTIGNVSPMILPEHRTKNGRELIELKLKGLAVGRYSRAGGLIYKLRDVMNLNVWSDLGKDRISELKNVVNSVDMSKDKGLYEEGKPLEHADGRAYVDLVRGAVEDTSVVTNDKGDHINSIPLFIGNKMFINVYTINDFTYVNLSGLARMIANVKRRKSLLNIIPVSTTYIHPLRYGSVDLYCLSDVKNSLNLLEWNSDGDKNRACKRIDEIIILAHAERSSDENLEQVEAHEVILEDDNIVNVDDTPKLCEKLEHVEVDEVSKERDFIHQPMKISHVEEIVMKQLSKYFKGPKFDSLSTQLRWFMKSRNKDDAVYVPKEWHHFFLKLDPEYDTFLRLKNKFNMIENY